MVMAKLYTLAPVDIIVTYYLVVFLLVAERLEDDRDENVQHHKCHEDDARENQEGTKHWVQIQDLQM